LAAGCATVPEFEPSAGEKIVGERPASLWRSWEAVGGKIIITTQAVHFRPRAFNVHKSPVDIPVGEITKLTAIDHDFDWGTYNTGLKVETSSGTHYVFVVSDRDYVMGVLEGEMQKAAKGSSPEK
jgi:hypothetical protein